MKQLLTGFFCSSILLLHGMDFDRGGVTFPMEKISAGRFAKAETKGKNLLKNADLTAPTAIRGGDNWWSTVWIFDKVNRDKFEQDVRKIISAKVVDTESGKALELNRPAGLETLMGGLSDKCTIAFSQYVTLPDENGGTYQLMFDSRNQLTGSRRYDQMVLLNFYDGSDSRVGYGKTTRNYLYNKIAGGPQWHLFRTEFTVPPGTRYLMVAIRADGCGKLQVKNLTLNKINAPAMPVTVELAPGKLLDNTFVLASGDPGIIAFKLKSNLPKGTLKTEKVIMNLELPPEISLTGTNRYFGKEIRKNPVTVDGQMRNRWEFEVSSAILESIRNSQDYNGWNIATAMISADAPAGKSWNCRYFLTENGKMISDTEEFTLKMMPSLPAVTPPKHFFAGFSTVNGDIIFHQPEADTKFARFSGKSGSTLFTAGISPEYAKKFYDAGIRLITAESYPIANGYRIGIMEDGKKPEYSKYLDKDGKTVVNGSSLATCPTAVYNRTPYYKEVVLPALNKGIKGRDGLQPNWEPYSFVGKGCFCANCRNEFAKFTGLTPEKVKEIWPQQLLVGYPYRDQAIRFRAWQQKRLILTLHEDAVALGASKVGFCPEVGTDQMIRYPNHFQEQGEFSPYEYAGKLKWLNVWGPYVWFLADQPYNYVKGANLLTFVMAQRVNQDYRKHFPEANRRAKLMAMPQGSQINMTALAQPEAMAMDQISSFLTGYDASSLYFFPRGYDHRFWREFMRSTAAIAANEEMVMNGKSKEGLTVVPLSPFPAPVEHMEPKFLPDLPPVQLLQILAFEKDGRLLAAVGNFWEKGDVVFRLQVPGLQADQEYSVAEKAFGRHFVSANGKSYTGKDLAAGIPLHAGAMRWMFFEIEPAGKAKQQGIAVPASRMKQELERCRQENKAAAEAEAKRDRALQTENDIGEFKKMSQGSLSCEEIRKEGRPMLKVVSGKNTLLLDPRGMVLDSWMVNGTEQASPGFGVSAFWTPGRYGAVLYSNYRLGEQKISDRGVSITAEIMTNARNYPQLTGLKIVKTIQISSDLRSVTFKAELQNTLATAMNDVGYRWGFTPPCWNNRNQGGAVVYDGNQTLKRPNDYSLLLKQCDPASERTIRTLFQVKKNAIPFKDASFRLLMPGKSEQNVSLLPADQLSGVAVWDTPNLIAATFEPFYCPTLIAPGGSVTYQAQFEVK